jgi:serine/threonine protein kinase
VIGRGGFGQVFKGKLHGTVCAVKEIAISPQNTLKKINHEIGIMGDVRHPNLVALLGAHTTKDLCL